MKFEPYKITRARARGEKQSLFEYAFEKEQVTPEEMWKMQTCFLWRSIRAHVVFKCMLGPMEPLSGIEGYVWYEVLQDRSGNALNPRARAVADLYKGLSLLPEESAITQHVRVLDLVRRHLSYSVGSEALDDLLLYGLDDIDNWPCPQEIIEFEHLVLSSMHKEYLYAGTNAALEHAVRVYKISREEAINLLELSRSLHVQGVRLDPEKDRKEAVLRLEGIMKRSQETMDLRAELQAVKQLSTVQGLDAPARDTGIQEFLDLVIEARSVEETKAIEPTDVWVAEDVEVIEPPKEISDD